MAALGALASSPALAQAIPSGNGSLAGMRFYDAEQLTPAAAKQNYFDGAGGTVTYNWASQKPWEITAAAAALENDPQKIFAFVKNYVRFEPRFGAQKGAVGAIIDRSGTAFDQAQLLVELLRAAGITASYQVGTLTLTGAEFTDWTGIVDATAARQFLANGGIPVEVVGSTSISSVTLGHAWVTATIGGAPVALDPSYKRMDRWAQIEVAASSGLSPAGFVSLAASATVQNDGNPYVTGVNLAGAKTVLDTAATTLLNELRGATYKDKRSEEIAGGERIRPYDDPWANKTTGTLSASWGTYEGGLPDKYRTKVAVGAATCQVQFFADEVYGRRVLFRSPKVVETGPSQPPQSIGTNAFAINEKPMPGGGCPSGPNVDGMSIAVNLPYAARAAGGAYGSWMDRSSLKQMDFGDDAQVVLGWGDAGSELQARVADDFRISEPWSVTSEGSGIPGPGSEEYYGPPRHGTPIGPAVGDAKLYAAWLAQMTRAATLLEGVSASRIQHHYTIGVVYTQIQRQVHDIDTSMFDEGDEPLVLGSHQDSATRINIDSGYSTTSLTGSTPDKLATRHLIAALGAMLEGSMFEQQMDAVDTSSTAQRLPWAQENLGTIRYHRLLPGSLAPLEYRGGTTEPLGVSCKGLQTANLGYAVIQPNDRFLGPGTTKLWTINSFQGFFPYSRRAPQSDYYMHRGCAWIAFNADASEIAHIVTSIDRELKGAGGSSKKDTNDRAAPMQADLLKDTFKDRSNIEGVDLRTGAFTYKPAPDLVVGQGEFPYSLSFQRVFQAGGATCPKCVSGWTHNFDIRATVSGGGLEGMGQTTPLALAAPLVGIKAAFEIYKADPNGLGNHLGALGVMRWLSERLTYNVVTVNQGASSETFVRVADRTFAAPPGSQSTLVQIGERYKFDANETHGRSPVWLYGTVLDPNRVKFVRTSGAGDKIEFKWLEWNPTEIPYAQNDYGSLMGFAQGFFADTWTFPQGASLTFTYCNEAPVIYSGSMSLSVPCADRLKRVGNNLGVWIDIDRLDAKSSDGRSTFVTSGRAPAANYTDIANPVEQYPYVATGFVDVAGKWRAYEWEFPSFSGRPSSAARLKRILAPVDYTGGIDANDDTVTAQSGIAKLINPLTNDKPEFGLVIADTKPPTYGTITRTPTSVTYTSNAGYSGQDMFEYKVRDASGASMWAKVYLTVTLAAPANRPPAPSNKEYVFFRVGPTIPVTTSFVNPLWEDRNSDPDGDPVDFTSTTFPIPDFEFQESDKRLKYTNPAYTYGGPRIYQYTITDPHGATGTATMSVTVPNRPPEAFDDVFVWDASTGERDADVLANDKEYDGDPVTVTTNYPGAYVSNNKIWVSGLPLDTPVTFEYTLSDGYHQVTANLTYSVIDSGGCRVGQPCN